MTPKTLALLALAAFLLSGCTASNGTDGQKVSAAGSLAYNGVGTGTDQAKPFTCGTTAEVQVSSNLGSGDVKITVKDGSGAIVYSKTLNSPGQNSDSKTVNGAAGTWSLTAVREAGSSSSYGGGYASSFSGQYVANVDC